MKTIIIAIAALAAVSTSALAERNYDISSPPVGETVIAHSTSSNVDVLPFTAKILGGSADDAAGNGTHSGGNSGGSSR